MFRKIRKMSPHQLDSGKVRVAHLPEAVDFGDGRKEVHNQVVIGHVARIVFEPLEIVLIQLELQFVTRNG